LAWQELCEKLESNLRQIEATRRDAVEKERRRKRPKSRAQKRRMVETKRLRRKAKDNRGRVNGEV
jgi:hypothetical protein